MLHSVTNRSVSEAQAANSKQTNFLESEPKPMQVFFFVPQNYLLSTTCRNNDGNSKLAARACPPNQQTNQPTPLSMHIYFKISVFLI